MNFKKFLQDLHNDFWPSLYGEFIKFEFFSLIGLILIFAFIMYFDKKSFQKLKSIFNIVFCAFFVGIVVAIYMFLRANPYIKVVVQKILTWHYLINFLHLWVFLMCGAYLGILYSIVQDVLTFYLANSWGPGAWRLTFVVTRILTTLFMYYGYILIQKSIKLKTQKKTVFARLFCFMPIITIGILVEAIGNNIFLGTYLTFFIQWYIMYQRYTFQIWVAILFNIVMFSYMYYYCYFVHLNYFKNYFENVSDSILKENNLKTKNIIKNF